MAAPYMKWTGKTTHTSEFRENDMALRVYFDTYQVSYFTYSVQFFFVSLKCPKYFLYKFCAKCQINLLFFKQRFLNVKNKALLHVTIHIHVLSKYLFYSYSIFFFNQLTKEKEHGKLNPRPGKVSHSTLPFLSQ